jgi:hypothetical protein
MCDSEQIAAPIEGHIAQANMPSQYKALLSITNTA